MQVEHRITIQASPASIFRCYEDVEHWHTWDPDTKLARIDGPLRVGARGSLTPTKGNTVPIHVVAVEPDRSFTVESRIPGLLRMVFEHELLPQRAATEVVHRITLGGVLACLIGPLLVKRMNAGLPVTLATLKRMLETRGRTGGSGLEGRSPVGERAGR